MPFHHEKAKTPTTLWNGDDIFIVIGYDIGILYSFPLFPSAIGSKVFANFETNLLPGLLRRRHQGADRIKDDLELLIIFLLHFLNFSGKILVRNQHLAESYEGTHDGYVNFDGTFTLQNA